MTDQPEPEYIDLPIVAGPPFRQVGTLRLPRRLKVSGTINASGPPPGGPAAQEPDDEPRPEIRGEAA